MTERLPRVTAAEAIRALERAGFALVRQSGSPKIYKNPDGKRAAVPYHPQRFCIPGFLQSILRDAGLTTKDFKELMG